MRTLLVVSLLGLTVGAAPCLGEEPKVLTPAQVEKDRPDGEVAVTFQVDEVGLLRGAVAKLQGRRER